MIKTFTCKETEALFNDRKVFRFQGIENQARRRLLYLNRAKVLQDLRVPPGNELEALKGDRAGLTASESINNGASVSYGRTETPTMSSLSITIKTLTGRQKMNKENAATEELLDPIHPGEILLEDFMKPFNLSINQLAREIDVPAGRISEIVNGKRAITADTALRLGRLFGVSPEIWTGLQTDYELRIARRKIGTILETRIHPLKAA
jgi:addiction module HigA family antidote